MHTVVEASGEVHESVCAPAVAETVYPVALGTDVQVTVEVVVPHIRLLVRPVGGHGPVVKVDEAPVLLQVELSDLTVRA